MMWTQASLFCLLLLEARTAVCFAQVQCSVAPVGALHPVQGLLERFGAGPGCEARESGDKETHVISVGGAPLGLPSQVTVLLRPLSYSHLPVRPVTLVLSSQHAVSWYLEGERLPSSLAVSVQVSAFSDVQTRNLVVHVQRVPSLPWRPSPLLRWVLKNQQSLSSLNHMANANRVYLRLGEDPTMPSACQLEPLFLSHNYLTSDLQLQPMRGCTPQGKAVSKETEVHVIRLQSAGSGMCGSLQVEVPISVLPPAGDVAWHELVLILSSATPVNWALTAIGLQGHISVHTSNTVSPLYPSEPGLTMTSTVTPSLYMTHDLLGWAKQHGFPLVTSYTEAKLANHFIIRLTGGGAEYTPTLQSLATWVHGAPGWGQEHKMGQWPHWQGGQGPMDRVSSQAISTECQDGLLKVVVDTDALQPLPFTMSSVTLRDPRCQAQNNGSHFLLVFPVISCGTEAVFETQAREAQYRNTVLLWRDSTEDRVRNRTGEDWVPLFVHVTCQVVAPSPTPGIQRAPPLPQETPRGLRVQQKVQLQDPPGRPLAVPPILSMRLSMTEGFERRMTGPYIIMANSRIYVEVSARGFLRGGLEVESCVVSPLSHPQASPGWTVMRDGCSHDATLTLAGVGGNQGYKRRRSQETVGDSIGNEARSREMARAMEEMHGQSQPGGRGREGEKEKAEREDKAADPTWWLRFSFVLRPIYSNPIQFLHCQLRQCDAGLTSASSSPTRETPGIDCLGGVHIPALIPQPHHEKCHYRTLSRPIVVTQPVEVHQTFPPPAALRPRITEKSKPSPADVGNGIDTGPVVGIVFAAFLMGIGLMGTLWCIHSHTGMTPAFRRGSLLHTPNQSAPWSPPALMEHSNSSV